MNGVLIPERGIQLYINGEPINECTEVELCFMGEHTKEEAVFMGSFPLKTESIESLKSMLKELGLSSEAIAKELEALALSIARLAAQRNGIESLVDFDDIAIPIDHYCDLPTEDRKLEKALQKYYKGYQDSKYNMRFNSSMKCKPARVNKRKLRNRNYTPLMK